MSVALPSDPSFVSLTPRLITAGADLPGLVVQRVNRLGDRFACDVVMPPMMKAAADIFYSKLIQSKASTAVYDWPLPDAGVGSPGSPLVNGAGQAGMTLNADGFTASYAAKDWQPFNIIEGGRRYLHFLTADTAANGSGQAALPLFPMMRVSPSDNAVLDFATPKIEGLVDIDSIKSVLGIDHTITLSFTLTENR